jgi:hypothetical protein
MQVQQESRDGRAKGEGGYERRRKGEKSEDERMKGEEGKEGKRESEGGGHEGGRYLVQSALWFPVFSLPGITAADVGILRSVKDKEVDEELEWVRRFLESAQRPAAMEEKCLRRFLGYARQFFLKDG